MVYFFYVHFCAGYLNSRTTYFLVLIPLKIFKQDIYLIVYLRNSSSALYEMGPFNL